MHFGLLTVLLLLACSGEPPSTEACLAGEHREGDACIPDTCGDTRWGAMDGEAQWYVDPAVSGGDGTQEAPFSTVVEALDAAGEDELIALADGIYAEPVVIDNWGVTLAGRCPERTRLEFDEDVEEGISVDVGRNMVVNIQDLSITGSISGVIGRSGGLTLERVQVENVGQFGIIALKPTTLVVRDAEVRHVATDGGYGVGYGIVGWDVPQIDIFDTEVEDAMGAGVLAFSTTATLDGVTTMYTRPDSLGGNGLGIYVEDSDFTGMGLVSIHDTFSGLGLLGGEADLDGVEVIDPQVSPAGSNGNGVQISDGCSVKGRDIHIEGAHEVGLSVMFSKAELSEVVIENVQPGGLDVELDFGWGVFALGSELSLARSEIREVHGIVGNAILTSASTVRLLDSAIVDTQGTAIYCIGSDLGDGPDTDLYAQGLVIEGFGGSGIFADSCHTVLVDATVDGGPVITNTNGGVSILNGDLQWVGGEISNVQAFGLAADDADVRLNNVVVSDVIRPSGSNTAIGVGSQNVADVTANGLSIENIQGPGLYIAHAILDCVECDLKALEFAGAVVIQGGALLLEESHIANVGSDAAIGGGFGVYSWDYYGYNWLDLQGVSIDVTPLSSVYLRGLGSYRLEDLTLSGNGEAGPVMPRGNGIMATDGVTGWDGSGGLYIGNSLLAGFAGGAVFLDGAYAILEALTFSENGVDVVQQGCSDNVDRIDEFSESVLTSICPDDEVRVEDVDFYLIVLDPDI